MLWNAVAHKSSEFERVLPANVHDTVNRIFEERIEVACPAITDVPPFTVSVQTKVDLENPCHKLAIIVDDLATVRDLARRFAATLRRQFGRRIERIRLFGSLARGDFTTDSDVDVLVMLDRVSEEDRDWILRKALSVGVLDQGIIFQPLILAKAQFEQLKRRERRLALEIERDGIEL